MKCSKCGFELTKLTNYCPACGAQLSDEEKAAFSSQKHPAKKMKAFLWTALTILAIGALFILLSPDITDTVKDQLKAIREERLEDAYRDYTSKAFQQATPFEKFAEYMKSNQALLKNTSVRFVDRFESDDSGELDALVETSAGNEVPVQYKLVYEGDQWRILRIKMEQPAPQGDASNEKKTSKSIGGTEASFDSKPLEEVIKKQLEAIRSGDVKSAYGVYTSKDFKKITTYNEFETFVNDLAGVDNNAAVEVGDLTFDNNIASLTAKLKNREGKSIKLDYDLVYEDNAWKIVHLDVENDPVADNGGTHEVSKVVFKKFVLGTSMDKDGIITNPDVKLESKSGDIYLNLYISGGSKGEFIEVVLEYVDSTSRIEPIRTHINEDGDSILSFSFSPPKEGWPEGNYRFLVNSGSGEISSYDFKIK